MRTAIAAALLLVIVGCDKKPARPEPTYQGKTRSAWLALTKDRDAKTREVAYVALGAMGPADASPDVIQALRSGAETDDYQRGAAQAAISLYNVAGEAGPAIAVAHKALAGPEGSGDLMIPVSICKSLKADASPLLPDIDRRKFRSAGSLERDFLDEMKTDIRQQK